MIPTIAEKKKVQQSQRSYGSHSPAIAAITIAEIELFLSQRSLPVQSLNSGFHIIAAIANFFFFFFSAIAAIVAIIWKHNAKQVTIACTQ